MKKLIVGLLLLFVISIAISACTTPERCDAYKKPSSHSRY